MPLSRGRHFEDEINAQVGKLFRKFQTIVRCYFVFRVAFFFRGLVYDKISCGFFIFMTLFNSL